MQHSRLNLQCLALVLCVLSFACTAPIAHAVACGAKVEIPGPMPRDAKKLDLANVNTSQWGFMTQSSLHTHRLPLGFGVRASPGAQKVSLWFSKNVTHIRVSLGRQVLYEGEPIKVIDALVMSDRE